MIRASEKRRRFLERLEAIERRLVRLSDPDADLSELQAKLASQHAELKAIQGRIALLDSGIANLTSHAARADDDLRACVRQNLDASLPLIEERLQSIFTARHTAAETAAGNPSARVNSRVTNLEAEVAKQRAALIELQECSLRTEVTMQKVLKGIDRLISAGGAQAISR